MSQSDAGKGDSRRPCQISLIIYGLRFDLMTGAISIDEYNKKVEELDEQKNNKQHIFKNN